MCDHRLLRQVVAHNLCTEVARRIEVHIRMARHRIAVALQLREVVTVEARHILVAEALAYPIRVVVEAMFAVDSFNAKKADL